MEVGPAVEERNERKRYEIAIDAHRRPPRPTAFSIAKTGGTSTTACDLDALDGGGPS